MDFQRGHGSGSISGPLVALYGRLYKVTCAWLIFSFVLWLRHTLCKYALIEANIPKLQPEAVFSVFEIGVAQVSPDKEGNI